MRKTIIVCLILMFTISCSSIGIAEEKTKDVQPTEKAQKKTPDYHKLYLKEKIQLLESQYMLIDCQVKARQNKLKAQFDNTTHKLIDIQEKEKAATEENKQQEK